MDRRDDLPPDPFAARAEQALRGGACLLDDAAAFLEQEEQGEQRKAKQDDAVDRVAADIATELAVRCRVDLLRKILGPAGMREVVVPPFRDGLRDLLGQLVDRIGHRDAVGFRLLAVIEHIVRLAHRFDTEHRERHDEDQRDREREEQRQDLAAQTRAHLRRRALEQGPQRDRQHRGPDERAQVVRQHIDADAEQRGRERDARGEMPVGEIVGRGFRQVGDRHGLGHRLGPGAVIGCILRGLATAAQQRPENARQLAHRATLFRGL